MWIIVEILVVAALVLAPLWACWPDGREVAFDLTMSLILSFGLWVICSFVGTLIGFYCPTSDSWSGDLVSIGGAQLDPLLVVRTSDGMRIHSYEPDNLQLQETEEEGTVVEITTKFDRCPTWWPRVLRFLQPPERQVGEPAITIKARREKLEEILAKL